MTTLNTIIEEENTPDTEWESVEDYVREFQKMSLTFTVGEGEIEKMAKLSNFFLSALTSRDTYWKDRVRKDKEDIFGEIEQFKSEVETLDYNDEFKDGIYATIEHILSMPCFESVLTTITEESI